MVSKAFQILSEADLRAAFDSNPTADPTSRNSGMSSRGGGGGGMRPGFGGGGYQADINPEDLFNMFFGMSMSAASYSKAKLRTRRRRRRRKSFRGRSSKHLHLWRTRRFSNNLRQTSTGQYSSSKSKRKYITHRRTPPYPRPLPLRSHLRHPNIIRRDSNSRPSMVFRTRFKPPYRKTYFPPWNLLLGG